VSTFLGTDAGTWLLVSGAVMGLCAALTGQALASAWRPLWQVVPYALLLAAVARFLIFALFDGTLLAPTGYLSDAAALIALAVLAHRATAVRLMARQYPWLYERSGLFALRRRPATRADSA